MIPDNLTSRCSLWYSENNEASVFLLFRSCSHLTGACSQDSNPGEVDLHGLYVKEAVDYTGRVIEAAKRHGETTIKLIVGSPVPFLKKMAS